MKWDYPPLDIIIIIINIIVVIIIIIIIILFLYLIVNGVNFIIWEKINKMKTITNKQGCFKNAVSISQFFNDLFKKSF